MAEITIDKAVAWWTKKGNKGKTIWRTARLLPNNFVEVFWEDGKGIRGRDRIYQLDKGYRLVAID